MKKLRICPCRLARRALKALPKALPALKVQVTKAVSHGNSKKSKKNAEMEAANYEADRISSDDIINTLLDDESADGLTIQMCQQWAVEEQHVLWHQLKQEQPEEEILEKEADDAIPTTNTHAAAAHSISYNFIDAHHVDEAPVAADDHAHTLSISTHHYVDEAPDDDAPVSVVAAGGEEEDDINEAMVCYIKTTRQQLLLQDEATEAYMEHTQRQWEFQDINEAANAFIKNTLQQWALEKQQELHLKKIERAAKRELN